MTKRTLILTDDDDPPWSGIRPPWPRIANPYKYLRAELARVVCHDREFADSDAVVCRCPVLDGSEPHAKTTKKSEPKWMGPKSHHLDRHALTIAAAAPGEDDDTLLTQREMAAWFRCSEQWLIAARHNGYGPPYERLAPRVIRYRRSKVTPGSTTARTNAPPSTSSGRECA